MDVRGLDRCKEDKGNPTRYMKVRGEEGGTDRGKQSVQEGLMNM